MNEKSNSESNNGAGNIGAHGDFPDTELLHQLDRATVFGENQVEVSSAGLNDETIALHDAWLAFGRLLEAADATMGKAPSIAMPREIVSPSSRQVAADVPKGWRRARSALLVWAACMAGVALIVAQWRFLTVSNGNKSTGNNIASTDVNINNIPNKSPVKESATGVAVPEPQQVASKPQLQYSQGQNPKSSVNASASPEKIVVATAQKPAPSAEWDDPDDKQIAQEISAIELDIAVTQRQWDQQGETSQAIEYRINEDEQEVDKNPL